jgi:hypothetical protein
MFYGTVGTAWHTALRTCDRKTASGRNADCNFHEFDHPSTLRKFLGKRARTQALAGTAFCTLFDTSIRAPNTRLLFYRHVYTGL